ncbi:hypothetical protein C8Q79DRAFT_926999 [Trametes meyenii]|nr:hypothetical protein C8Q79DRAFT_926999 [Trametes meyenii]
MPPPDYIPTRGPDSGPQRPLSATDLHFPHHGFAPERAPSGPQRVALGDGMSGAAPVRSGPIRPAMLPMKPPADSGSGDGVEKKERVVGGARRVLRLPETTAPAPTATSTEKTTVASGPIRPRVISTSRSTPAVPLRTAAATVKEREEALKAKKLASSQGASGKAPGSIAAATAAAAAKHAKTNSGGVQAMTASARARAAERAQEKEKAAAKSTSKTVAPSRASVPSSRAGAAGTVTVRDRNRTTSGTKPGAASAKPSTKDAKTGGKSRAGTQEPSSRAQSVAPVEVPLPESPKATAEALPSEETHEREADVPNSINETSSAEAVLPVPQDQASPPAEAESVALIDFSSPSPTPAAVPLPSSRPASPAAEESPFSIITPEADAALPTSSTDPSSFVPPAPSAPTSPPSLLVPAVAHEAQTPEQVHTRRAEVEQTPISALVASIERGFFAMRGVPLSPMREEEDECSIVVPAVEESSGADPDARVFDAVPVKPLFVRRNREALHA